MLSNPPKLLCRSEGDRNSKIALIGEAPGITEERCGKPFVGSSGDLLMRLAAGAGLVRSDCYITNVIKERPKHNDVSSFITFSRGAVHTTKEYDRYEAQLYDELSKTNANVYVAVGSVAL